MAMLKKREWISSQSTTEPLRISFATETQRKEDWISKRRLETPYLGVSVADYVVVPTLFIRVERNKRIPARIGGRAMVSSMKIMVESGK